MNTRFRSFLHWALLCAGLISAGCADEVSRPLQGSGTAELLRRQEELLRKQEEMRRQQETQRRQQEEQRRREQQLQVQRKWTAKKFADLAGKQIMNSIGGGRDLVVDVIQWNFSPLSHDYEIDMQVSFNGSIIRSNNYRVGGRLTVKENGSHPRFARTAANQAFKDQEDLLTGMKIGVMILEELSNDSKKSTSQR